MIKSENTNTSTRPSEVKLPLSEYAKNLDVFEMCDVKAKINTANQV